MQFPKEPSPGPPLSALPGVRIWVVGYSDLIVESSDGGAKWEIRHELSTAGGQLFGVAFAGTRYGWAVGKRMIYSTRDAGSSWTSHTLPVGYDLSNVACSDTMHAWAVGFRNRTTGTGDPQNGNQSTRAVILATSDGGLTWKQQSAGNHEMLVRICCVDAQHAWAVGRDDLGNTGIVVATSDGGAHWLSQSVPPVEELSGIAFTDARHGWAVGGTGNSGVLLKTNDGGAHWKLGLSQTISRLNAVAFPDARHGWAVGEHGLVLATTDGGSTWFTQPTEQGFYLTSVSFSDALNGWMRIATGHLLATRDGGRTWRVVAPLPGYRPLGGVQVQ